MMIGESTQPQKAPFEAERRAWDGAERTGFLEHSLLSLEVPAMWRRAFRQTSLGGRPDLRIVAAYDYNDQVG